MSTFVDFEDYLRAHGLAERTISEYSKWSRRLLRFMHERGYTGDPTAAQLREWGGTIPKSWASRKQAKSAVLRFLAWQGLPADAAGAIPVPRKPRMKSRALEPDEATMLRNAAVLVGGRRGLATLAGLYMAARAGEIAGLTWKGWQGQWFSFERTKTSDTHRVPVHPTLAEALEDYRRSAGTPSLYIFPGDGGAAHVTPATVWSWVKYVGAVAGVEVSPHRLRHTALTAALEATKDLRAVMDLAGHRDPTVTAGYTRLSGKRLTDAVLGLDY